MLSPSWHGDPSATVDSGQGGFALVEAIISIALVGGIITTLVITLAAGVRGTDVVAQRTLALQLAASQLESIKNQPYAEPISYAAITPPNNDFQIGIGGSVLQPGFLQQVTAAVTYLVGNSKTATLSLSAYKVNHFPPIIADKPLPPPTPPCPIGATCFSFGLHNNPTPPTGDTNAQPNLPMDSVFRVSYTQYNYDANRNSDPGLTISRGGSGADETDLAKYQNWRTSTPFESSFHIQGDVEAHIWSASSSFQLNRKGEIRVFLRDFSGTSYTEIANKTLLQSDWQAGFANFVLAKVVIPNVNYTIPSGHYLEVKLLVGSNSQTPTMWFNHDFVDFQSIVYVPTSSP